MFDKWRFDLGVIFMVSSLVIFVVGKQWRASLLKRLQFHRRRTSQASTPPRSISPEKITDSSSSFVSSSSKPDYANAYPPSRRFVLPELAKTATPGSSKILLCTPPDVELQPKDILPITRPYDLDNSSPKYTPTGFSTAEIKAMGDFPAYDTLSGVPLPQPYENFDPKKALPRPYRPFRWAYHQTMCRLIHTLLDAQLLTMNK